jgi:hypothetical protein
MSVEITVTWHFIGDGDEAVVSYHVGNGGQPQPAENEEHASDDEREFAGVLPLNTSVLAPGLAAPLAPA